MAGTPAATEFAPYIDGLTVGGEKCEGFASCLALINAGGDPDYDGASGPLSFTDPGEPALGRLRRPDFICRTTPLETLRLRPRR